MKDSYLCQIPEKRLVDLSIEKADLERNQVAPPFEKQNQLR